MLRLTITTALLCLLASTTTYGYSPSLVGNSVSGFHGSVLMSSSNIAPAHKNRCSRTTTLQMKKGKAIPPQMRGQYERQKEMAQMRDQMVAASKPGADGLPVFNLYVRTKRANMWYPCGSFKGDDKSKALASNYRDNNLLAGMSKKQLDSGIAASLYRDLKQLNESTIRAYPQLRKSKDELQYGYKLAFEGLPENEAIVEVEPKEQKGVVDNIKNMFGGGN